MSQPDSRTGISSPPAGTGNVPGLGEAFSINLNTGQGVYSYKLPLPDGVAGHAPRLTLEYAHGTGLNLFGLGWRLPIRSITRRLDHGVSDQRSSELFLDSGTELVEMDDGSFATLSETVFTRFTRAGGGWRIEERNGIVHELGSSAATRIADPAHPDRVHEYLLERSLDPSGNEITYSYLIDGGWAYVAEIRYAAYAVRFSYENRGDVRRDGRAGFLRTRAKRCRQIQLFLDPGQQARRIRSWHFVYEAEPTSGVSLLKTISMVSHGTASDGSEDVARAPVRFDYSRFDADAHSIRWMEAPEGPQPPPLSDPDVALVTLDDAPLPGVLQIVNGHHHYWRNRGDGSWGHPRPLLQTPTVDSVAQSGVAFVDADGSGTADMIVAGVHPLHGYYQNDGARGWAGFVAYPRGKRATPAWDSGRIRLTDTDGDGRIDAIMSSDRAFAVWSNNGDEGWSEPILTPKGTGEERPDLSLDDPLIHLADMTGDGLQDLVEIRSGRIEYWPSLGRGRFGSRVLMTNSPRLRDLERESGNTLLTDVDGDGCSDLVRVSARGVEVYFNRNGTSFSEPVVIDTVPMPLPGTVRPMNMNGRTRSGLVWNSLRGRQPAYVQLEFGRLEPPHVLTTVDNGSGLTSQISYRWAVQDYLEDFRQGTRWQTNLPFPLIVVAGSQETDRVTGQTNETQYRYHEGHFEPRTRQFQGFKRAERIDKGDESRADVLTVFHYLMAEERRPGHDPEHAALNGVQRRTEVYSLDGSAHQNRAYRIEECTYGLRVLGEASDGRKRVFVSVSTHRVEDHERTDDRRVEEKDFAYDNFGNVTRERLRGFGTHNGAAVAERERIMEIDYARSATSWVIDRPSRVVVRDENGAIIAEKRRYYDEPDFRGLPLGQVGRGLMTREEQLVMSEQDFQAHYAGMDAAVLGYRAAQDADGTPSRFVNTERYAYGPSGVRVAERDALGNEKRFQYEPGRLFRIKLTDALGETQFEYDRAVGQPTRILYPDGARARFFYDAQGRVRATVLPGDDPARPPRVFTYDDSSVPHSRTAQFRTSNASGATASAVSYFDGRGKEFQQRVETGGGRVVVSGLSLRNPWGDIKREYGPADATTLAFSLPPTDGRPRREMYYDGRGRAVRTVDYSDGVSLAEYRPFEVTLHDANDTDTSPENVARGQFNTPRREEFDVFRDRTRVVENVGGTTAVTSFVIGPGGDVLRIDDSHGALCTYEYDKIGRRLVIAHREAGQRRLWYDGRGKVVRARDADGRDLRADIDALGRLTRLRSGSTVLEQFTYDDPARNALGRLAEVSYRGGRQRFRYDSAGRMTLHEYRFDNVAAAHTLAYEYDPLGREVAVTHTDGTRIARQLTPNGWTRAIPGFLNEVVYDPRGLPTRIVFANGVTTEIAYTEGPGRVKTQRTVGPTGQVMEDVVYSYDQLRLLLGQTDAAPGGNGSQTFDYDPFYQLRSITGDEGGGSVTRRYEYVDHFNLSRLEEVDNQLHYDDAAHPNRIAGITHGAAARVNLNYDANGNLLTLPGRTFHYNAKNELVRFEGSRGLVAEYRYDHQGHRISKTVDDGHGSTARTLFLGDQAEIRGATPTYFVNLGELRVGIIRSGVKQFVHSNYLGSTAFFSDRNGMKIAALAYRPFGNLAASSGNVNMRTYGTHPFDAESGLYYMKRRYYAPEIGRFLTPDPIAVYQPQQVLHRPRALHPYAYVGNDPLNNADPEGLSFWSVVGAIVGVIAAVAVGALIVLTGGLLLGVIIAIGVITISYVVADATAGTGFGEFMRGFMIGFNAGLNAMIATALFGPVVGITLGVINFLAAFDGIAASPIYQGILGWSSWLMPMSWLATGLGLLVFLINVIVGFFAHTVPRWLGGSGWDAARINSVSIDWGTGTIVMHGGLWTLKSGGYNLGNFAYIHRNSTFSTSLVQHETGHTLNVAAYGAIFHYIGAIDENVIPGRGASAYAEKLADSHDPTRTVPDPTTWQEMWV
jgi:RHS repeat-associated protein